MISSSPPPPPLLTIADAIQQRRIPIKDGLYLADGSAIELSLYWEPEIAIETGVEFNANRYLQEHPDWVSHLDLGQEIPLANQQAYCLLGEGSYGADGCAVCLAADRSFKWALFLQESNSFDTLIQTTGTQIVLGSTAGLAIAIDIEAPWHMQAGRQP